MRMAQRISGMFLASCLLAGAALASDPTALMTMTVTTTSHGYAIPLDFSGLAFSVQNVRPGQYGVSGYVFDPTTNPEVLTLFQNLGIRNMRIGSTGGLNPQPAPALADIDQLFSFAAADDLKVIFSSDLRNGNVTSDATNAAYILDHYQTNLYSFALDNETDFHSGHTYCTASGCTCTYPTGCTGNSSNLYTVDPLIYETAPIGSSTTAGTAFPSYLADWQKFVNTIVSSAPGATFSGPDTGAYSTLTYTPNASTGISWTQALAKAEKGAVNGLGLPLFKSGLQHFYVGGSASVSCNGNTYTLTAEEAINNMLSTDWVTGTTISSEPNAPANTCGSGGTNGLVYTPYPWLNTNNMAPTASEGASFRITESNDYLGGVAGASNGYASALWALDYMQWWAQHGAEGVNFENNPWILTDTIVPDPNPCNPTCGDWQVSTKGYGIKAFDFGSHGYVEPISISNPSNINVTAYAVGEGMDTYVTIINKTHLSTNDITDAVVTIKPNGFATASAAWMPLSNGDPGNASSMTATLGGGSILNNARWVGTWNTLSPDTGSGVTLTVPSTSAAVVRIHAASNFVGPIQMDQNGALEMFGTDSSDKVWHAWQMATDIPNSPLSNWSSWTKLSGVTSAGGTAVVKNQNNTLEVFAPSSGNVYHNWQLTPNGAWSGWADMGSSSAGIANLQAANNADGSLSVFGIGSNGDVWTASESAPGVGWSGWTDLTGQQIQSGFVVEQNLNGHLEVFGVDDSGNLWHNWQTNSGTWSGWNELVGASLNPRLAVARNLDGRLEVFGIGNNSHIRYISQTEPGGAWSTWSELGAVGGGVTIEPGFVVGQNADGRFEILAVGSDTIVYHIWITTDGAWSSWTSLGGLGTDPQLVISNTADGRLQVFGIGSNKDVYSNWQTSPGGAWNGWADFGENGMTFYPGQP